MLTQKELMRLADKYEALHKKNFDNYQECGEQKYLRASERYEDMADAFRMAANAEEDYSKKTHYGLIITSFATRAAEAIRNNVSPDNMENILADLVDTAAKNKLYWKK